MPSRCPCGCRTATGRVGVYVKGHQPAGTSRDPLGKDRAQNAATNKKWNPIINKKRKTERRKDAEAYLIKHGRTGILSNTERQGIAHSIATDRTLFDDDPDERLHGKSLDDLFADPTFCGYLGETMRSLGEEALRWITPRGGLFSGNNRPVLAWAPEEDEDEPQAITQGKAKTMLGFSSVYLWKNEEKPNTTFVEDQLQERYHDLGLPRRLHRCVGMGNNGYDEPEDEEGELHKVFLAYSFHVQAEIDAGLVAVVL